MRGLTFLIIFLLACNLFAVGIIIQPSAYHHALSGLSLLQSHPSNNFLHPALSTSGIETSITRLFNLKQLPFYNFHSAYRYKKFSFFLGNSYLDNKLYSELTANIGLNYRYKSLRFGSAIQPIYVQIENFKSYSAFPINLGIALEEENFSTVFTLKNSFSAKLEGEYLPMIYLWETSAKVGEKTKFSLGLEKEDTFDFSFKFGSDFQLFSIFNLLCSYQINPNRMGVGAVFAIKNVNLCYSIRTHQQLNLEHYITLSYEISN